MWLFAACSDTLVYPLQYVCDAIVNNIDGFMGKVCEGAHNLVSQHHHMGRMVPLPAIVALLHVLLAAVASTSASDADPSYVSYLKQRPRPPIFYADAGTTNAHDLMSQCTEHVRNTTLDHFSWVRSMRSL